MSDSTGVAVHRDHMPIPAEAIEAGKLLNAIIVLAKDPAVDVAKLSALMDMQERMEVRQAQVEFNRALSSLPTFYVKKNGRIDLTRKDGTSSGSVPFAKWEDMSKIIEPELKAEGFRLMFDSQPRQADGGGLIVTGTLLHRDGHSKSASMPLALDTGPGRNNLQAMGSTLSYGKRYCTEMLLNIVREDEDDDGKRGGTRYISEGQAAELRELLQKAGRQEGPLLDRLFSGQYRSFDELEVGGAHLAVKNTLDGIIHQQKAKG